MQLSNMKNRLLFSLLFACLFTALSCNKSNSVEKGSIYKAKIMRMEDCAKFYACVIKEGAIDPTLVDNNWEHDGMTYNNAFFVANRCAFPSKLKTGDEFEFILSSNVDNNCTVCNIGLFNIPSKSLNVKVLQK